MIQIVCIPYSNRGTVLHYESEKEFIIDYTRIDFGVFYKEDELNDNPYAFTRDYVHDYGYHYNYADFFGDSDDEKYLGACKSVYFRALARIALVNQLRIFYVAHGFDKEFIHEYSLEKGTKTTNRFFEIAADDFADVMIDHFDLFDFEYGFMCDSEHVPELMSLIDQEEYGSPRWIPYYKPLASEHVLNQLSPDAKAIAFIVRLDFICYTLLLKNIDLKDIISSGNLTESNDILAKL